MNDLDDFTPWTSEGAARLRDAAAQLAEAILAHADAVAAVATRSEFPEVMRASDRLMPHLIAYADAQLAYCGNGFPLGVLQDLGEESDPDDRGLSPRERAASPFPAISVLQRYDYEIVDESRVIAAGRAAYQRRHANDHQAEAESEISTLGAALTELERVHGWHGFGEIDGLEPTASWVGLLAQYDPLGPDMDAWPANLFSYDVGLLTDVSTTMHTQ